MQTPKFTAAKTRAAHGYVTNKQVERKNYAMVLLITLSFTLITSLQTSAVENTQTVQKELPAVKTDQPPTLDGVLDDACWLDAPQAIGFTDERTEKPAKNQSIGRLVYTDKPFMLDFISTMICPTKLWRAKPKIRPESEEKTGFRSVLTRFTRISFRTGISSS